jgi:hypothetical protein
VTTFISPQISFTYITTPDIATSIIDKLRP